MTRFNKLFPVFLILLSLGGISLRFYDIVFFVDNDGLYIKTSAVSLVLALLVILLLVLSFCFGFFVLPKQEIRTKKANPSSASAFFMTAGGFIILSSTLSFLGTDLSKFPDKTVLFTLTASFFGILCGSFFIYSGIQLRLFSRFPYTVYAPVFSVFWALFRMIADFISSPPLAAMSTRSYRTVVLASMCLFLYFFAKSLSGVEESSLSRPLCAFGVLFSSLASIVLIPDIYFYISIKDITSVIIVVADLSLAILALLFIYYRRQCPTRPTLH